MTIKLRENLSTQKLDDKLIILDLDNGVFFEINESGYEIFKLIKSNFSYDDIVNTFAKNNALNGGTAKNEVDNFLIKLKENSVIA